MTKVKEGVDYGSHSGFGWIHIWKEELRSKRFYNYYKGKYTGEALQRKMLEDMEDVLRYGKKIGEDAETIKIEYNEIVVKISKKYPGSIQTTHPLT